ncbi:MAG: hypothetical protein M3Z96_03610 [Pseudomonadota bacterium]|nr:hypothetical protein [Pseudomonadota bacterium]
MSMIGVAGDDGMVQYANSFRRDLSRRKPVMGEPAKTTEYGLSDYVLGPSLPMSGYPPRPGVYCLDTFFL